MNVRCGGARSRLGCGSLVSETRRHPGLSRQHQVGRSGAGVTVVLKVSRVPRGVAVYQTLIAIMGDRDFPCLRLNLGGTLRVRGLVGGVLGGKGSVGSCAVRKHLADAGDNGCYTLASRWVFSVEVGPHEEDSVARGAGHQCGVLRKAPGIPHMY